MQHSSKHNLTQLQQHPTNGDRKQHLLFSSANLLRFLSETNDAQLRICWGCQTPAFPSGTWVQAHILTSHNAQHNITRHTHICICTCCTHARLFINYTRAHVELVLTGPTCAEWNHLVKDGVDSADRGCVEPVLHHVFVESLLLAQGLLVQKRIFLIRMDKQSKTVLSSPTRSHT